MTQLSLFPPDIESVPSINALSRDEKVLMFTLGAKGGGAILPPVLKPQIITLKRRGYIRDSLLDDRYIELTPLGDDLLTRYAQYELDSGRIRICKIHE